MSSCKIDNGGQYHFLLYIDSERPSAFAAVDRLHQLCQNLDNHLMTRYLRVLKLRGSSHGSNNYPFSLTETGVSLLPVTATRLTNGSQTTSVSTGIARIDSLLGGEGYIKGASLMISGRAVARPFWPPRWRTMCCAREERRFLFPYTSLKRRR